MDVYSQVPVMHWPASVLELVRGDEGTPIRIWVTATSSNIAKEAYRLLGECAKRVRWVAISQSVARILEELGASEVLVADHASYDGVCTAVMDEVARNRDRLTGQVEP
jgi:uroporphyrinogen-III synthase